MDASPKTNKSRSIWVIISIVVAVFSTALIVLFNSPFSNPVFNSQPSRTIVDMGNKTVTIPYNVQRVACHRIQIAESILVLGGQNKLVAYVDSSNSLWMRKVFPGIMNVTPAFTGSDVNIEQLLAAKPDVVFLQVGDDTLYPKITAAGIPVVQVSKLTDEEMNRWMLTIGEVMGADDYKRAIEFNSYFNSKISFVADRTVNLTTAERPSVLYLSSISPNYVAYGMYATINDYIQKAGGINVATTITAANGMGTITAETILTWDPDIIIVSTTPDLMNTFLNDPTLHSLKAIQNGNTYINPRGIFTWSSKVPESPLQVMWLGKTFHPERFNDLDMRNEIKTFFNTFYNYPLTDIEAEYILNATTPSL